MIECTRLELLAFPLVASLILPHGEDGIHDFDDLVDIPLGLGGVGVTFPFELLCDVLRPAPEGLVDVERSRVSPPIRTRLCPRFVQRFFILGTRFRS